MLTNGGATASIQDVTVAADSLGIVCHAGAARLRGILFTGASGSITHTRVVGVNQGASGCQEGNAIEVRNIGEAPETVTVHIAHNTVEGYQKMGIVANGDVDVVIEHNRVGASATQANLAANSIQLGFGAKGVIQHNDIEGNQWCGASDTVATAVLVFEVAAGSRISHNDVHGNSDVGLYLLADGVIADHNRVRDEGTDCNQFGYDIGIGNYGDGNEITKNTVGGFDIAYEGVTGGRNKTIRSPHD